MVKRGRTCVRCVTPTPAVEEMNLAYQGASYVLALCDKHAGMLQTDLWAWLRLADQVDDERISTGVRGVRREVTDSMAGIGGEVIASHVAVPVSTVTAPPERHEPDHTESMFEVIELPAEVNTGVGSDQSGEAWSSHPVFMQAQADGWRLTEHALERASLRLVDRQDAILAAISPNVTMQPADDGTQVRIRGKIKVVVNPQTREIITVARRNA